MADTAQTPTIDLQTPPPDAADASPAPPTDGVKTSPKPRYNGPSKFQQLNKLYALPAPLRTFPLPTFVPHNPLSLFHILYVWLRQTVGSESTHFDPPYQGWYSPETRSIHVTDARSIRGLWEQGFYGKGSLSRSEPSWMTREKTRRGIKEKATSEENTAKRRLERQQAKWERARKEREAIDQKRSEEAEAESILGGEEPLDEVSSVAEVIEIDPPLPNGLEKTIGSNSSNTDLLEESVTVVLNGSAKPSLAPPTKYIVSPVGPLELLSLPNSSLDSGIDLDGTNESLTEPHISRGNAVLGLLVQQDLTPSAPVGPLELLALPNSVALPLPLETIESSSHLEIPEFDERAVDTVVVDSKTNGNASVSKELLPNGHDVVEESLFSSDPETSDDTNNGSSQSDETVQDNTMPNGSALVNPLKIGRKRAKSVRFSPTVEKNTFLQSEPPHPEHSLVAITVSEDPSLPAIKDQEHTQLTLEEAFFLSYALGALTILSPTTNAPIPTKDLFYLFRASSYFPPRPNPALRPDDPFMINYVVYHHFRSLGWVPRPGIKFSCDLMLYNRGPVFDHAEFGVIILPNYSDAYWKSDELLRGYVDGKERRTWHWMNCINRVITQVKKTLILCYVDIPAPLGVEEEEALGVHGILGRYKIREVVMKRFSANRMRD